MARLVRIEGIEDPIGPGTADKAVRVTESGDGPGPVRIRDMGETMAQLLVEMKITNWLLAAALPYLDNLKWMQPLQGNGGGIMQTAIDVDQLRDELVRNQ